MQHGSCGSRVAGRWGAWTRKTAGAIVLVAGTALAVPAAMALSAAPAGAATFTPSTTPTATVAAATPIPAVKCTPSVGAGVSPSTQDWCRCPGQHDEGAVPATEDGWWWQLCGSITITKTDSWTGNPLAGATFTIYGTHGPWDSPVCDTDPLWGTTPLTTDSTGTVTFSPLAIGTYCVAETTAPAGYTGVTTPAMVTVSWSRPTFTDNPDGPPTVTWTCPTRDWTPDSSTAPQSEGDFTPDVCVTNASFTNAPDPVNINISKYGTANTGLNGATFTLETTGGTPVSTGPGGVVNGSNSCITLGGTSTAAATCSILNIMIAGTYQLAETSAPTGYNTVPPIPVTVTLGTPPIQVIVVDTATVVPTAAAGGSSTAPATAATGAVSGATTVHTGEAFAGSKPFVLATMAFGATLLGFGLVRRRRMGTNA